MKEGSKTLGGKGHAVLYSENPPQAETLPEQGSGN